MVWEPRISLIGDPDVVKISATEVGSKCACGRQLALKVRPDVKSPSWQRLFPPHGADEPFPLADVIDVALAAQRSAQTASFAGLQKWLAELLPRRGVHRLVQPYVTQCVENYLDLHETLENILGKSLELVARDPAIRRPGGVLTVWAPVYRTDDRIIEVRRFRIGSAHDGSDEGDQQWAALAAEVALSHQSGLGSSRVRVLDIGPVDGSHVLTFDGSPDDVHQRFNDLVRPRISDLLQNTEVVNCSECGSCKVAGACESLVPVVKALGQSNRGYRSRSVSASELTKYAECPGRWLLESSLRLPREMSSTEAQSRGLTVHQWLEVAHRRGIACTIADLPRPGGDIGIASGVMDTFEYAVAYPFLVQHVNKCPLALPESELVLSEENLFGFDTAAEVVIVSKPDLVYRVGETLIAREVKTGSQPLPNGRDDAYGRSLQVALLLQLLSAGMAQHFGYTSAAVEIEHLTPTQSEVWRWETTDTQMLLIAAGDVRRAVEGWHEDSDWLTTPGPQCSWCHVRKWCPDRDLFAMSNPLRSNSFEVDDEPPF